MSVNMHMEGHNFLFQWVHICCCASLKTYISSLLVSGPSLFMTLQLSDYILQSKIAALGRQIESRGASLEDEYSTFGIDAHRST